MVNSARVDDERGLVGAERLEQGEQHVVGRDVDVVALTLTIGPSETANPSQVIRTVDVVKADLGSDLCGPPASIVAQLSAPEAEVEDHIVRAAERNAGPQTSKQLPKSVEEFAVEVNRVAG